MITDAMKYILFLTIIIPVSCTISCSGKSGSSSGKSNITSAGVAKQSEKLFIRLISPEENKGFKLNDQINVVMAIEQEDIIPDSVKLYFDSKPVTVLKSGLWEYTIPSSFSGKTGRKALRSSLTKAGTNLKLSQSI